MSVLANIVGSIRKTVYGKDMREFIAKGFETIDAKLSGIPSDKEQGGFVLMSTEDIPIEKRKEGFIYGQIVADLNDTTP